MLAVSGSIVFSLILHGVAVTCRYIGNILIRYIGYTCEKEVIDNLLIEGVNFVAVGFQQTQYRVVSILNG